MRISDWSSDVCSSDLDGRETHYFLASAGAGAAPSAGAAASAAGAALSAGAAAASPSAGAAADRKSVVSGKSVSVRVDLGGRRIIKKTKHHKHNRSENR